MANHKVLKFGPVVRFRVLEGDFEILRAATASQGQTLSAYLRDAAIARALDDLGADTRDQASRKLARAEIAASDL